MHILIAPDKFKHSLSADAAADAIAAGVRSVDPHISVDLCPMADGGEGTVAALHRAHGGRLLTRRVTGPLPEMKVEAAFALLADGRTAVIEMAAASGLALLPEDERDPLNTTTFGTGELIAAAVREGARRIILGLGGSATVDGGVGCAQACGFTVLMDDGQPTSPTEPLCGRDLQNVLMVKHGRGEITSGVEIIAAYDVTNPLLGPRGAAAVFGPQKGATPAAVQKLDTALAGLVQRQNAADIAISPGAGAAGGLGFAMAAFFGATLRPGGELVAESVGLARRAAAAQLCITGEGKLDDQSSGGKVVAVVGRICRAAGVPCIALVGSVGAGADQLLSDGVTAYFSICDRPMPMETAQQNAGPLLKAAAAHCVRMWMFRK